MRFLILSVPRRIHQDGVLRNTFRRFRAGIISLIVQCKYDRGYEGDLNDLRERNESRKGKAMRNVIAVALCLVAIGILAVPTREVRIGPVRTEIAYFDVYTGLAHGCAKPPITCSITVGNSWSPKIPGGPNDYFQFIDLASAQQLRFWGDYDLRVSGTHNSAKLVTQSYHNGVRWDVAGVLTNGLRGGGDLTGNLYGAYNTESPHLTQTYTANETVSAYRSDSSVLCTATYNFYVYQS